MMQLTIIGFGNQAKSWALNLKESGFPVRVALRPSSSSIELAKKLKLDVIEIGSEDFYASESFALLTPDQTHHHFLKTHAHSFRQGSLILYAHGFSLLKHHLQEAYPEVQHILFAPKAIGSELRNQYLQKGKLGAVYSLEYLQKDLSQTENWLKTLATSLGINLGPYKTTFKNETQADLFSEQGLLCSLIPYTAGEMFKQLVDKGIEPELAYFECWHELKLIVNAMVDIGPDGFFDLISPNALIGSEKGFHKLLNNNFNHNLTQLLTEIQDGTFNNEINHADVEQLRKTIRNRWKNSALQKTFLKMNQDLK
jgi:ketol-acid reductoisomerase